jgi:predicted house-cleaning noncanonical NTP pyrophosphatase (MazG superfamily)
VSTRLKDNTRLMVMIGDVIRANQDEAGPNALARAILDVVEREVPLAPVVRPPTEKLVRHRVPAFFEAKGEKCETRVADRSEMLGLLRAKLVEETEELVEAIDSGSMPRVIEEAVDLWEVLDVIRAQCGAAAFEAMKNTKADQRGTFHQGIVLNLAPPVPMVLLCPKCGGQHVDRGVWASTRIHRTHLCERCGETWKPYAYATVGVERV